MIDFLLSCESPTFRSSAEWLHISSQDGTVIPSGTSRQQTASLILDVDKDGLMDFIIGSRNKGASVLWYRRHSQGWNQYVIEAETLPIEAGGTWTDIDGDGDLDVVFGADYQGNKIWWWENPYPQYDSSVPWTRREIKNSGANKHHDQIFGDFDGDGQQELVFWNQGAHKLCMTDIPENPRTDEAWHYEEIFSASSNSEGLAAFDMDGDGLKDIIGGGYWFKYIDGAQFVPHVIDTTQSFARVAVGQLREGGWPEVVFVPGDAVGPLRWYEWTGHSWEGHDLLDEHVDHGHSLEIADFNNDKALDIFCGEMRLNGDNPDAKMWIFWGDGDGHFHKEVIAEGYGVHEAKVGDLDGDEDLDILGKPYDWDTPRLDIWLNTISERTSPLATQWERHVIDAKKPWQSVFITAADMDHDGYKDIITGAWWYKNPGEAGSDWTRNMFGAPLYNMALVYDFDGDGDMDVLGTQGKGSTSDSNFVWARNEGAGVFSVLKNISKGDGDFLQGVAAAHFQHGGSLDIALSWHKAGKGIQILSVPKAPSETTWPWHRISSISQDECLSAGDIDGDGLIDLLLGTKWLHNTGKSWDIYQINEKSDEPPDRNRLADINGDGKLDAVVGFEAISRQGNIAWYEQGDSAIAPWTEHLIASVIGPMSLDVADMDADGDLDIVVGEHNLKTPSEAKLYLFENADGKGQNWQTHVIYTGDEHHDGTRVVDIDGDGDWDIISIGWGHGQVLLYENKSIVKAD